MTDGLNGTGTVVADAVLGRLADPRATKTEDLPGACRCPGSPHLADTVTYRTQIGGGERASIRIAGYAATGFMYWDAEASNDAAIEKAVTGWTLLSLEPCEHLTRNDVKHPDGDLLPVPVTRQMATLLDEETRSFILERLNTAWEAFTEASLPNGSGAPSAASSQASASPNRATRRRRSSTTD